MPAYVCVTHALSRREETDNFCRLLSRYGFRFACIHEQSDPQHREETLAEAALLIALACPAAAAVETVASDIRRGLERGMPVLCVSMRENELDARFCASSEGGAVLIPAPAGDTPDRHTVALFVHRLFVRHLSRLAECFSAVRCVEDTYGRTVASAVAAHKGDPEACYALGQAYERGEGVPKLETEAARWIAAAAEGGVADACIRMGELYLSGCGIERNPEAAFTLFTAASEAGDPGGDYHRGLCYLRGLGVVKDPERAFECLEIAARRGYAAALYELGGLYRDGIGVARDPKAAARAFRRACALGIAGGSLAVSLPSARFLMGRKGVCITMRQLRRTRLTALLRAKRMAEGGAVSDRQVSKWAVSSFARNRYRAVWPLLADRAEGQSRAAEGGEVSSASSAWESLTAKAAVALGRLLAEGDTAVGVHPRPTRAPAWYRLALRLGSADAVYRLGEVYRRGYGVPPDRERAFRLFSLAAELGDEKGRFALGVCYERGLGTPSNTDRAFLCYQQAALAGYAPAQNNLGGCYERGIGTARDMNAAVEWYARAAASLPEAVCRLGLCYEWGRGVNSDPVKALRLYESAAAGGNPYAKYRLALCYDRGDLCAADRGNESEREGAAASVGSAEPKEIDTATDYVRAARLLEQAARDGVADAAYVLSLYYAVGRGVRRDERLSLTYLTKAAEGGVIPACYGLGLCYLEGRSLVRSPAKAVACFARAAELWEESGDRGDRAYRDLRPRGIRAAEGLTESEAAGAALYMLGYCVLYGIGDEGNPALGSCGEALPSHERVSRAAAYFEAAARAENVKALTALGDLYAYGLLRSDTASAEDEALGYYMEAARVGTTREFVSESSDDSPIDALMSLAERSMQAAETASAEGDEGTAELSRVSTWRSLAGSAELGSLDAFVSMAACAYHGYGTPQNRAAARWFLERAAHAEESRVTASLWLGDLYYAGMDSAPQYDLADEAYLRAIRMGETVSECGNYTLRERREAGRQADIAARAEACYRIAVLRAVHFAEGEDRREAFSYLAKAVLMGHAAAREDLARMYAYETAYINATTPQSGRKRKDRATPAGVYARHRLDKRSVGSPSARDGRAGRSHNGWMNDYYTALWPVPALFKFAMEAASAPADRPAYVSAEVTPPMLAAALNYLGDCLFFGEGLPADPTAAASCYREVVRMRITVPRGEAPPNGLVWAQYSYGWCLLHGIGVPEQPREAVAYLTLAAKTHAEACYCLGECFENGVGVDVADSVEAFKYYRKALKLGYRKAAPKVLALEKRLKAEG